MPYKIIKPFTVATKDVENLLFPAGTFIDDYKRSDKVPKMVILSNYQTYLVQDFDIESHIEYVETIRALVKTDIRFHTIDDKIIEIPYGTVIEYERWNKPDIMDKSVTCDTLITIRYAWSAKDKYTGPDFDIENYVESIEEETPLSKMNRELQQFIEEQEEYTRVFNLGVETGKSMKEEEPYTVQVEIRPSRTELNEYLKTIPGKNVIDIKPMEHNCYLVIYKEIEK